MKRSELKSLIESVINEKTDSLNDVASKVKIGATGTKIQLPKIDVFYDIPIVSGNHTKRYLKDLISQFPDLEGELNKRVKKYILQYIDTTVIASYLKANARFKMPNVKAGERLNVSPADEKKYIKSKSKK